MNFRQIRILLLLSLLGLAAGATAYDRYTVRGWRAPLRVEIRPLNGDGRPDTARYIDRLRTGDFAEIERFLAREAARYGLALEPAAHVTLQRPVQVLPPPPPVAGSVLANAWWSLRLRWWSYRVADDVLPSLGVVRLYLVYHSPQDKFSLSHSLGLQKGLIGVVNVWAAPAFAARNQVVMAHELLHTLGASDKYDPATNLPLYPYGYAEPAQQPLYPQTEAEIMAGRIARSATRAVMPPDLRRARVGARTAREIGLDAAAARYWEARG